MKRVLLVLLLLLLAVLSASCGTDTIVAVRDSEQVSVPPPDGGLPPREDGATNPTIPPPTGWRADGGRIVDGSGNPVKIRAVTWSGFEEPNATPHGIYQARLDDILDRIVELKFDTLRLPFSNELLRNTTLPTNVNFDLNPDLRGKDSKQLLDEVIDRAGARGLRIILVHNRSDSSNQEGLWYTAEYPQARFREDWAILAFTYSSARHVVAFELHEGLREEATWGDGNTATDWRLAAEDAGSAILERNQHALVIVNGVQTVNGFVYVPGGNLAAARDFPVRLPAERLVYGAADYPPDYMLAQFGDLTRFPWLVDPAFPANLPAFWESRWAYLASEGLAPVMLTSFGSKYRSVTDRQWLDTSIAFLQQRDLSFAYWLLNPTIGTMEGILEAGDWYTTQPKYEAVRRLLPP